MAEEGLAIEREINTPEDFPIFHCLLAEAQAAAGEPERALAGLRAARDEFRRIGLTVWMPEIWRSIGDLTLRLDPDAVEVAAAAYEEAARLAEAQGAHRLALRALLGRARLAPWLGGQAAVTRLAAARARILEADDGADLREAEELMARLGPPAALRLLALRSNGP
jgi:predicted ATPase